LGGYSVSRFHATHELNRLIFILSVSSFLVCTFDISGATRRLTEPRTLSLPPEVTSFIADKERQVKSLADRQRVELWPEVLGFFKVARQQSWPDAGDLYEELKQSVGVPRDSAAEDRVSATALQCALEVDLALEQFAQGDSNLTAVLGREIVHSIPKGSVYFGGTDAGRGLATAFCKSHAKADPIFVLTQNALADGRYLTYLRDTFGASLHLPTESESADAFQEYLADARRRLEHDKRFPNEPRQIKPGEDVRLTDNKVTVAGQVAVMSINGALAKRIFDRNPDREFYIEESFPIDWMYPHLSPHGFILKMNRKPLSSLSEELVQQDRTFWAKQQRKLIGDWLRPETPVKTICDFADTVFVKQDLDQFEGDPSFVAHPRTCEIYAKLRSAVGGVYAWRARQATTAAEKERMRREADFAFRQAFAFCPGSAEAVFRYVSLLADQKRYDDALCLTQTSAAVDPGRGDYQGLIAELERLKAAEKK
jgi:hypothetical protein